MTRRTPRAVSGERSEARPYWAGNVAATTRQPRLPKTADPDATTPECASRKVTEAGRPKTATTRVEWPPDLSEAENPAVALALTRLPPELSRRA